MIEEVVLLLAAFFATLAALSRDDVYASFSLGTAILFASLYVLDYISTLIGIIIFAIYTGSVVALVFMGYAEEKSGLSKLVAIALPLAFAIAVAVYKYIPAASVGHAGVSIDVLKELIIPIAGGLAAVIVSSQEVRNGARGSGIDIPNTHRARGELIR